MIEIEHSRDLITVRASGKLTAEDYDAALPELEQAMDNAGVPLRLLIRLEDFHGWEIRALWSELKFDLKHRSDPGRVAVLGETAIEEWGTRLSAPFAKAEMRFFSLDCVDEALDWLRLDRSAGENTRRGGPDET